MPVIIRIVGLFLGITCVSLETDYGYVKQA
jgi:hypothetical protein